MSQNELHFEPDVYQSITGTQIVLEMREERRIDLIIKELKAIYERENKRSWEYTQLPYEASELLLEAIDLLEKATEWGEPSDDYLTGEPPITMDEMHTAAWKQHQEMHS